MQEPGSNTHHFRNKLQKECVMIKGTSCVFIMQWAASTQTPCPNVKLLSTIQAFRDDPTTPQTEQTLLLKSSSFCSLWNINYLLLCHNNHHLINSPPAKMGWGNGLAVQWQFMEGHTSINQSSLQWLVLLCSRTRSFSLALTIEHRQWRRKHTVNRGDPQALWTHSDSIWTHHKP